VTTSAYLADTSALMRILHTEQHYKDWLDPISSGMVAICPLVELEYMYSARSLADRLAKQRLLNTVFPWVGVPDRAYDWATNVQQHLTETDKHRSAGAIDLLIAATAAHHRLSILTEDRDYLAVADVTGQPVTLLLPRPTGESGA
jgi:predicted nucleic acid-binding protein